MAVLTSLFAIFKILLERSFSICLSPGRTVIPSQNKHKNLGISFHLFAAKMRENFPALIFFPPSMSFLLKKGVKVVRMNPI